MIAQMFFSLIFLIFSSPLSLEAAARDITSMKEFREVLSQKKPLCIMFYAPWCSACKSMKEPFNKAADILAKDVLLVKVDADNEKFKEVADSFGVEAIPTIVFKHVGMLNKDQLVQAIQGFVGVSKKEAPKKAAAEPKKPAPKKSQSGPKKGAPPSKKSKSIPKKA